MKFRISGTTKIEWVTPGSAADQAGLKPGDIVTKFDDTANPDYQNFTIWRAIEETKTVPITVDRSGATIQNPIHLPGNIDPSTTT